MRRICVVTGSRAEYGLLRRVMRLITEDEDLCLQTVATGMHLSPEFGHTVSAIEADGFRVDAKIDMLFSSADSSAMAKGAGIGIYGLAQAFDSLSPDIVLILGDRVEAFAAASAAALSNRVVAHIHGGDKTHGGLDESMRHAITKLSHLHFPATENSARRIRRMGEAPERISVVGAPGLDEILDMTFLGPDELAQMLGLNFGEPVLTVVQHSVSTEPHRAEDQMQETLEAVRMLGLQAVVIAPNSDPGNSKIRKVIKEYEKACRLVVLDNLPRQTYLSLVRASRALVGNSSSGIIEAPVLGTPVVNVGERQLERETAGVVLRADYDSKEIAKQIKRALSPATRGKILAGSAVYGVGDASARIVSVLKTVEISPALYQKVITY